MNILIVGVDFKPNVGGMAEYTHQIARHLHLAGDNMLFRQDKNYQKQSESVRMKWMVVA